MKLMRIGELVDRVQTWSPLSANDDEQFTYLDLSSIDQDIKAITDARNLRCSEAPSRARQLVQSGDVLISTVRPNLNGVARVSGDLDGATASTGFCVLRPRAGVLDGAYLFHWVKTPQFVSDMVSRATGASYPAVSDRVICESRVPLPPIAEQRRIAEVLDRAEALRAMRRAALGKLNDLTQAIFVEMFGDPAKSQKRWPTKFLGELGDGPGAIVDGPFGSAINVNEDYIDDGEIPVIRTKNVRPFEFITEDLKRISRVKFQGLERSAVVPGDILLTKVGTIGHVCFFPPIFEVGVLSTTGSCRIRPNKRLAQPTYLAHFLHRYRSQMLRFAAEGVQPFLNMRHIKSFIVPLPPIELQREFSSHIDDIDRLKAFQRTSLAQLDALFTSLQQRAFAGML